MNDTEMTKDEKVANILAFLAIIFSEKDNFWFDVVMEIDPDYFIEKFNRYVESKRNNEYLWGMHPMLKRACFDRYAKKWKLQVEDL